MISRWSPILGLLGSACAVGFVTRWALIGAVDPTGTGLAVAGATALLAYASIDPEQDPGRRGREFTSATVILATMAACTTAWWLVRQVDPRWDLRTSDAAAISDASTRVAAGLDRDVEVVVFLRHGSQPQRRALARLEQFAAAGPRISVRTVDPASEPMVAQQAGVDRDRGGLVLYAGARSEHLTTRLDEDAITAALIRLTSDVDHRICWSLGHGEAGPDDTRSATGMGSMVLELEGHNHQVVPVSLVNGPVDPLCEVLVVARPLADWLEIERAALSGYLAAGGNALVMLEPGTVPLLSATFETFGIRLDPDVVLDPAPQAQLMGIDEPGFLVVDRSRRAPHPITQGLGAVVVLGLARSVVPVDDPPGMAVQALLYSSEQAWAERRLDLDPTAMVPDPDEQQGEIPLMVVAEIQDPLALGIEPAASAEAVPPAEIRARVIRTLEVLVEADLGPITDSLGLETDLALNREAIHLAAGAVAFDLGVRFDRERVQQATTVGDLVDLATRAAEARFAGARPSEPTQPAAGGRVVVIGDATFAENRWLDHGHNRALFVHSVSWLVGEEDQLGIRPPTAHDALTITRKGELALALVSVLLMPALPGILVFVRRLRP